MRYTLLLVFIITLSQDALSQTSPMTGNPGFFLDDWKPKKYKGTTKFIEKEEPSSTEVNVSINYDSLITKVSPWIFGNNSVIWMGRQSLNNFEFMQHLKDMQVSVLRYPGGNLSNTFFWDASGPGDMPPGVPSEIVENKFRNKVHPPRPGVQKYFQLDPQHYYDLLRITKANGSICVNYSYALYSTEEDSLKRLQDAANYAAEWVREVNVRQKLGVKFWEIGNENWGQWQAGYFVPGRGFIDPETYGKHCRVFIDAMKSVDPTIKIGVVGYEKPKGSDPMGIMDRWNKEVFPHIADKADYIILHSYFTKYGVPASPADMLNSVEGCAESHEVMNEAWESCGYEANHLPVSMTEFNTFSTATPSKRDGASNVSHTAGVFFAHALGEMVRQGFGQAMMWDLYNGWSGGDDHGMFASIQETDAPVFHPHPSFFHYYFYATCFGDRLYDAQSSDDAIRVYPTTFTSGEKGIVVINKSEDVKNVKLDVSGSDGSERYRYYQVHSPDPLARTTMINGNEGKEVCGGPMNYKKLKPWSNTLTGGKMSVSTPPWSATYIVIDKPKEAH